jgi:glycosyltransferase involved in cell wall biosynthesis
MPAVSVIIPTHNRPELLRRAVHSVLVQTTQDFEIVVIDDGIEERAEHIVASFNDSRVRYVAHPKSLGAPAARNRGVLEARAPLVAFLDDDDVWLPHKLKRQLDAMKGTSAKVAYCFSSVVMDYGGKEVVNSVDDWEGDFFERALRRFSGTMTSSLLVRREAIVEIGGFDESFPSHQEAEMMIRLSERYYGISIAEPLVRMEVSPDREHIGGDINRRIRGREMLLAKHAKRYSVRPYILARHKYWLAFMYRDAGRKKEALGALCEAWKLHKHFPYILRYVVLRIFGW